MARKKISQLDALALSGIEAGDLVIVYDASTDKAKRQPYYAASHPWLWPRTDYSGDQVMVAADMWKVITNNGASALRTFTLPAIATDYAVLIGNVTAHNLRIDPNTTQVIAGGGAGKYLELTSRGWVMLVNLGGVWEPIWSHGTWAFEP